MFIRISSLRSYILIIIAFAAIGSGCIKVKNDRPTATLLATTDADQKQLMDEVNRFARVSSLKAQVDLHFEDNSFAKFGSKEVYRGADGEIVVQRPASILLTVKVPVFKADLVRMSSDGEKFRVAILHDDAGGKYKKFVKGTNNADYSRLQKDLNASNLGEGTEIKQNVDAFASLRPQHFTDAMLVRPTDSEHVYTHSTTYQIEEDQTHSKSSPLRMVNRGYYLLDEFAKRPDGELVISRRFWFDRVGGIRLARQQLFDAKGEIESDIVYGAEGNLTDTGEYNNLPLQIIVTRPQEKYAMRLTYQTPAAVKIGKKYPATAFVLQNTWGLDEIDLDKKLAEATANKPGISATPNSNTATRFH